MENNNSLELANISKSMPIRSTSSYGGLIKTGENQILTNISFKVKKGEIVGILGRNGCGKSTLLKIITGIMKEDGGTLEVRGKVASILELGIGFDPELSGIDNVRIKGQLLGLSNDEIEQHLEEIISFSELGDQINHPLKTYSSGMVAKLSFAVLIYVNCDVLIIDEVLSVSDASFNYKCKMIFNQLKKKGTTVLLASHNIKTLETMCDRILWIDGGIIKEDGDPVSVCYHYESDMENSIDTLTKLSETGDLVSMNRLAIKYKSGLDVKKDIELAEHLLNKASEMGSIEAAINLSEIKIEQGKIEEARQLLEKAAKTNNALAVTLLMNISNEEYIDELFERIKKETDRGNIRTTKLLADILNAGNMMKKDQTFAIELYKKCAEEHDRNAQHTLGIMYRDGIGVERNIVESIKWFEQSFNHGNIRSAIEISNIYRKGIGIESDLKKATMWIEKAAYMGDPGSMLLLGQMYQDERGSMHDSAKANMWFKKYSDIPIVNAEIALADSIKSTYTGIKQKECIKWYEDAANRGHAGAMNVLGAMYRDGFIVKPDMEKAFYYYNKSAEMYNHIGLYETSLLYLKGIGTEKDEIKAFQLMKGASNRGNINATMALGLMIRDGIGTDSNINEYKRIMNRLKEASNNGAKIEISGWIEDE